jgi:hypothetical protein
MPKTTPGTSWERGEIPWDSSGVSDNTREAVAADRASLKLEKHEQSKFIRRCNAYGWEARKQETPGHAGEPDVRVLITDRHGRGHVAFVEFKRPGEEPTKLQMFRLKELRMRGFIAMWEDNADMAFGRIFTECKLRRIEL